MSHVIEECYKESIKLLKANSSSLGILASGKSERATKRNYLSVFARDASICALGMIMSADRKLISTAKISLINLAKHQAANGQIPNYIKSNGQVDFWRMGCIDATLWWLIAIDFFGEHVDESLDRKLKKEIKESLRWLECQEHPSDGLLTQNEASDWADIMPRDGKVLYSNALWIRLKERYELENEKLSKDSFNNLFYPFNDKMKTVMKCERTTVAMMRKELEPTDYYLSYVNYLFWGDDLDVYANSLALLVGLPDSNLEKKIIKKILSQKKKNKMPMPVLFNPIKGSSPMWRTYMESHKQNYPGQYHNGGIWPFASCFWAMALYQAGYKKEAQIELGLIAKANKQNKWEFNEWFHAQTGEAMGMKRQSWNAGAFILAYKYLQDEARI